MNWRVFFVFGWTACLASYHQGYPPRGSSVWGYFSPPLTHKVPSISRETAMDAMVDLTNDLGVAILQDHSYSRGNFAFSPYGVASVLVVLYEGARGESARQIYTTVGFPPDKDLIRIGFRDIHRHLQSYFSHEGFLSGISLNKECSSLKPEYKKTLRYYGYDIDLSEESEKDEEPNQGTVTPPMTKTTVRTAGTKPSVPPTTASVPKESTKTTVQAPKVTEKVPLVFHNSTRPTGESSRTTTSTSRPAGKPNKMKTSTAHPAGEPNGTTTSTSSPAGQPSIASTSTASPGGEPSGARTSTFRPSEKSNITSTSTPSPETTEPLLEIEETTAAVSTTTGFPEEKVTTEKASEAEVTLGENHTTEGVDLEETEQEGSTTESLKETQPSVVTTASESWKSTTLHPTTNSEEGNNEELTTEEIEEIYIDLDNGMLIPQLEEKELTSADASPTATAHATEQAMAQTTEQATEQASTQAIEQATDQTTAHTAEHETEQTTAHTAEQATEQTTAHTAEQATEQTTAHTTEQAAEQTTAHTTEQATEQTTAHTTEQATEQTAAETTEQMATQTYEATTQPEQSTPKLERNRKSLPVQDDIHNDMKTFRLVQEDEEFTKRIRNIVDTKVPLWLGGSIKKTNSRIRRTLTDYLKSPHSPDLSLQLQNGMYGTHISRNANLYRSLPRVPFLVDGAVDTLVPMMTYTNVFPFAYIPRLHAKALEFPLDDVRYKLLILLPVERRGLRQLIYDLGHFPLSNVLTALRPSRVKAMVPTFMVEGFVILTSSLQKLGIWDVFDPRKANLSGMSPDPELYVRNVEQSVTVVIRNYVEILDIQTRTMAARQMEHQFEATHPFLYFVLDTATNVALMAGQILDPLNSRIY